MWHCVTRPQRSKNLPLVNSYRVHSRMLEKALSETRVKVRGGGEWALCLCVGWGGGLCLGTWHKWSQQLLGFFFSFFCGSGANCSVTGGNTCLSLTKHHLKKKRDHSHPISLCLSLSYLPGYMHSNRGQAGKRKAATVTHSLLNCLFFCETLILIPKQVIQPFSLPSLLRWAIGHPTV